MLPYGCMGCPVVLMSYSPSALVRVSVAWRAVPRQLSHAGIMKPRPTIHIGRGFMSLRVQDAAFLELR